LNILFQEITDSSLKEWKKKEKTYARAHIFCKIIICNALTQSTSPWSYQWNFSIISKQIRFHRDRRISNPVIRIAARVVYI